MRQWLVFGISLTAVIALTPFIQQFAKRIGLVDLPNARKVHKEPIPLAGGIVMYLGFAIALLASGINNHRVMGLLLGGLVTLGVGLWDDWSKAKGKELSAAPKFAGHVVACVILILMGVKVSFITNPWGGMWYLPTWLSWGITILWVAGTTNLINFMDGLDGLASGISSIAAMTLMVTALAMHQMETAALSAAVMGVALGFLHYNFNPAKIFMGDAGAYFLGFTLGAIAVNGAFKSVTAMGILVPMLTLGVPIFDTAFNVIRRVMAGQPFYVADKGHTHHRLLNWGLSQVQTVVFIYLVSMCFSLGALVMLFAARRV